MVQRVPAHLGETPREAVSPWLMVGGIFLLIIVTCGVIYLLLSGGRVGGLTFGGATPTRTPRSTGVPVTIIPVTLPPASPTPGPTSATIKHRVRSGENLTIIADRYKVSVRAIMQANNLKDDTIRIGDELVIPLPTPTPPPGGFLEPPPQPATPTALVNQSPPTPADAATPGVIRHIVQRGDTLLGIAALYGSNANAIRIASQLESDWLAIGQELYVPVGAWKPTPTETPVEISTPTATPRYAYAAPILIWPPDQHILRSAKDAPSFSWTAPATLKRGEYYVLYLDYELNGAKKSLTFSVRQGTSLKLDAQNYPGTNPNGTRITWHIVVVGLDAQDRPTQISAPSAGRILVWY